MRATFHQLLFVAIPRHFRALAFVLVCCTAVPTTEIRAQEEDAVPPWALAAAQAHLAADLEAEGSAAFLGLETMARDPLAGGKLRHAAFEIALNQFLRANLMLGARIEVIDRLSALDPQHFDAEMRARWLSARRYLYLSLGELERARPLTTELDPILDWWILGPLDNERGRGFARQKRALEGWDPAFEMPGKERSVTWRKAALRDDVWGNISLEEMLRPNDQVMAFAIAFFESEQEREAVLRFSSDEAFRVWWNGELVAEGDVRRSMHFDQNRAPVRMRSGLNTCLLLVAEREGDWNFSARLTDPSGAPLNDFTTLSEPPAAGSFDAPDTQAQRAAIAMPPDGMDEARAADQAGSAFGAYCLGTLYMIRASLDIEDPLIREALQRAAEREPENLYYALTHAHALVPQDAERSEERDVNPRRWALEAIVARDLKCLPALLALAQHYIYELPQPQQAHAWLERASACQPKSVEVILLRSALLQYEGREAEQLALLEDAASDGDLRLREALLRAELRAGRFDAVRALASTLLERRPMQADALRLRTEEFLRTSRFEEAIDTARDRARLDPWSSAAAMDLFAALRGASRTSEAEQVLVERMRIAPEEPHFVEMLSELRFEQGRTEEGVELLRRAVALDPKDEKKQRYLRWRERAIEPFYEDSRIPTDTVLADTEIANELAERSEGEAFLWLLDQRIVHLNPDATAQRYVHQIVRIENEEGARLLDVFRVRTFPAEQSVRFLVARVLRPDGKIEQASFGRDARSAEYARRGVLDLPRLDPGDVVDIEYRHDDLAQTFFGNYFGLQHLFSAPAGPLLRSQFTIEHPSSLALQIHQRAMPGSTHYLATDVGELKRHTWELRNLASLQSERGMPAARELLPALEITTYADWDAFGHWWWNLIRHQLEPSPEMRAKVAELLADQPDERESIRRIYEFVIREIKYEAWEFGIHGYQPYDAATIFARRFGDCKDKAILLGAMLRLIDVTALPVLIRSELPRSTEDLSVPLVDHFNHCIAYLPASGNREELWLDGTAEHHPVEVLPPSDRGAAVLVVSPEGAELRDIPPSRAIDDVMEELVTITLSADGSAEIELEWRARGASDPRLRSRLMDEAARREHKLQETLTPLFGEFKLEQAEFSPLERLDEPVFVRARLSVPRFGDGDRERRSLPACLDALDLRGLFPSGERNYDLLIGPPRTSLSTLRYVLPEGFSIETAPSEAEAAGAGFDYERKVRVEGDTVHIERRFVQKRARIHPHEFPAARECASAMHAAEEERLRIRSDREELPQ